MRVCPISPAAPRWPPTTRPPATMPSPRPVEALTTSASRSSPPGASRRTSSSARASTSASLATKSGHVGERLEVRRQGDAVPAGHHRGGQADPALGVDRAGQAQADRRDGGLDVGEQRAQPLGDLRHQLLGTDADRVVAGVGGELGPVEVEDAELAAGAPDRDREHDAGAGVEQQRPGGPAAGRGELLADQQQPGGGQRLDPGDDRGAREPGEHPQPGAGVRATGADQLEEVAGGRGRPRLARCCVHGSPSTVLCPPLARRPSGRARGRVATAEA